MSTIKISNLTFGYPGQANLFTDQNLELDTSWHLGLGGRNGRGKTTLLNLLRGKLSTATGTINMPVQPLYFPQAVTKGDRLTWEVIDEVSSTELWQVQRELTLLGANESILYLPFASLSGGEQTKVLLAVAFADETGFPLLDEPTNHLDAAGRQQVADYLHAKKQGFIVIAHDRHFLDIATDHTLTIEKQQLVLTQGNFSAYEFAKKRTDAREAADQQQLRHDIGRLKQTAATKRDWAMSREGDIHGDPHVKGSGGTGHSGFVTARSARQMKKAKNLEHRMDKEIASKEQLLKNVEFIDPLKMNYEPDHHEVLLRVRELQLAYAGVPLFAPLTFELHRGERLALVGPNGSGKSSLIAAILGNFAGEISGEIDLATTAARSLVRQQYPDNTGRLQDFAKARHLNYEDLLNNLKKLGVERSVFTTPIELMSAGQQKKVELASSLATPSGLYIWDEPLNYLDVFNQDQLSELLTTVKPTMLLTEHDTDFLNKVASKVVTLTPLA